MPRGGYTPLYLAANGGKYGVVEILLEAGAEVDKADDVGETPLYRAAANGYSQVTARNSKLLTSI